MKNRYMLSSKQRFINRIFHVLPFRKDSHPHSENIMKLRKKIKKHSRMILKTNKNIRKIYPPDCYYRLLEYSKK